MKQYKLLKDLPTIEAGRIFEETKGSLGGTLLYATGFCSDFTIDKDGIKNFDEWFEEVEEEELPKEFFYVLINKIATVNYLTFSFDKDDKKKYIKHMEECKSVGNYFDTKEEAEKYLEYLKAKEVIKKDTKGFNPNWEDKDEDRFMGCWDFKQKRARFDYGDAFKTPEIYFKSREDISESFEKHPEEWKTYLTYEQ